MCSHDSEAARARIQMARDVLAAEVAAGKIPEYGGFMSAVCPDCDDFITVGHVIGPAMQGAGEK